METIFLIRNTETNYISVWKSKNDIAQYFIKCYPENIYKKQYFRHTENCVRFKFYNKHTKDVFMFDVIENAILSFNKN